MAKPLGRQQLMQTSGVGAFPNPSAAFPTSEIQLDPFQTLEAPLAPGRAEQINARISGRNAGLLSNPSNISALLAGLGGALAPPDSAAAGLAGLATQVSQSTLGAEFATALKGSPGAAPSPFLDRGTAQEARGEERAIGKEKRSGVQETIKNLSDALKLNLDTQTMAPLIQRIIAEGKGAEVAVSQAQQNLELGAQQLEAFPEREAVELANIESRTQYNAAMARYRATVPVTERASQSVINDVGTRALRNFVNPDDLRFLNILGADFDPMVEILKLPFTEQEKVYEVMNRALIDQGYKPIPFDPITETGFRALSGQTQGAPLPTAAPVGASASTVTSSATPASGRTFQMAPDQPTLEELIDIDATYDSSTRIMTLPNGTMARLVPVPRTNTFQWKVIKDSAISTPTR